MVDIAVNKICGLAFYFYFYFFFFFNLAFYFIFVMGCVLFLFQILRFGLVVYYYNERLQPKKKKKKNRWNTSVTQKEKIILKDYKKSK